MADLLNGYPIECFPIVQSVDENDFEFIYQNTYRNFELGDKLPYKTFCYDYSDSFIIFDCYTTQDIVVHVVENGIHEFSIPMVSFPNDYPISIVLDKDGTPLNIKSASDFIVMAEECREVIVKSRKMLAQYLLENNISPEEFKEIEHSEHMKSVRKKIVKIATAPFKKTWYNLDLAKKMNCPGIIGGLYEAVLASAYNISDVKRILRNYCTKYNVTPEKEINTYYNWAQLHSLNVSKEELNRLFL